MGYTVPVTMTARQMAQKRWEGSTAKERSAHGKMMFAAADAAMTPDQRSAAGRNAAEARWGKKKTKAAGKRQPRG